MAVPPASLAATDSYSAPGGIGIWSNSLNWSLGRQPGNLDDAVLSSFNIGGLNVTFDAAATANIASLTIDSPGHHPDNLFQAVNSLTTAAETVGSVGTGSLIVSGGTHTVNGTLTFGNSAGSFGGGNLSGGTLSTQATYNGNDGNGNFIQTAGTHAVSGTGGLYLGLGASGSGTYTLGGGLLSVTIGSEYIGFSGVGVFTQTGGAHTPDSMYLGYNAGSSGTYNLSEGTLSAGFEIVGFSGNGSFIQTGGSHTATTLTIGNSTSGNYSLSAGSLTFAALYLGFNTAAAGTFTLTGAAFAGSTNATEYIGFDGNGIFNQSGGTHVAGSLYVGNIAGSGTYTLQSGVLTANSEYVNNGSFNQTGGTHALAGPLYLGFATGTAGTYTLSNGSFGSSNSANYVGYSGNGIFTQNSGSHAADSLYIGYNGASSGTYTLSAGTLNVSGLNGFVYVGYSGDGLFNQNGATHSAKALFLAYNGGSTGTYTLSGGTLVTTAEFIGEGGSGVFNQVGGTHITTSFDLGLLAGSLGACSLSNGATLSAGTMVVGDSGAGLFTQAGGDAAINRIQVAAQINSSGSMSLSGGTLTVVDEDIGIGTFARGTFTQTAGVHTITASGTNGLLLGDHARSSGTFTLSGGSLNLPSGTLYVGFQGAGTFTQTGGSNSAFNLSIGSFFNGTNPAAVGSYTLSNNAVLNVASTESVGFDGTGLLNQTGGTHTAGNLVIAATVGSNGAFNYSGGSLAVGSMTNNGTFTQTGPTVANLGAVSGVGIIFLGDDFGPPTRANVTSLDQTSLLIKFTGQMVIASNAARLTNTVNNLTLNVGATLDLSNHELLTSTAPALIKGVLPGFRWVAGAGV
jgi:hypothetical protein